jgi:hypothetical protein
MLWKLFKEGKHKSCVLGHILMSSLVKFENISLLFFVFFILYLYGIYFTYPYCIKVCCETIMFVNM